MKVGVIGLGLIGGSIAKEIKIRSISSIEVLGYDNNNEHSSLALQHQLIDRSCTLEILLDECDIVVVAIPINRILELLPSLLDQVRDDQVIVDTGSTKLSICSLVSDHPKRSRFVAAHPLAGTEHSGPNAALMDLFKGKKNIICEKTKSDPEALKQAVRLFEFLGMETDFMEPEDHDKHMAYVSHLSHVSSFILSQTVLNIEKDEKQIFNLASTGFASTARLAKSNAATWSPIFEANSKFLVQALDQYILNLQTMRNFIDAKQVDQMTTVMANANKIKSVLKGITKNPND